MLAIKNGKPENGQAHQGHQDDFIAPVTLADSKPESEVPNLPARVDTKSVVCRAVENLRKLRERATEIKAWMTDEAYPFFFAVDGEIAQNGDSLLLDQTAGFELEGKPTTIGQMYADYKKRIREYLSSPNSVIRSAAHSARLLSYLSRPGLPFDAFSSFIDDLVEKGYLQTNVDGMIKAWERSFSLSRTEEFGQMGDEEEQAIAKAVAEQTARLDAEFHEANVKKAEVMAKKATITPDMLLVPGKRGFCFLYAPPQVVHTTSNSESYKVSEMWLLVELTSRGMIFVLESIGPQQKCRELQCMSNEEIGVKASTIDFRSPPDYRSFEKAGFTEDQAKSIRRLWNLVKRGINYWREHDEPELKKATLLKVAAQKAELALKANIPADQFFSSNNNSNGIALLEYNADWLGGKERSVMFVNGLLFFLIERFENEGQIAIRLSEVPEHLANFFEACQEDYVCGENYEGVPSPLREVLRAIRRQLTKEQVATV